MNLAIKLFTWVKIPSCLLPLILFGQIVLAREARAYDLPQGKIALDTSRNEASTDASWTRFKLDLEWSWRFSGLIGNDEIKTSLYGSFSVPLENPQKELTEELKANEASLQYTKSFYRIVAGWTTLSWGELLGPSLSDLPSPRDYREPGSFIKSEEKLSSPMLVLHADRGNTRLEAFFSPAPSKMILPKKVENIPITVSQKDQAMEWGTRLHWFLNKADFKALYVRHNTRVPWFLPPSAVLPQDSGAVPSWHVLIHPEESMGFTASAAFDSMVLRSEWITNRLLENAPYRPKTSRQGVLALDYTLGDHILGAQVQAVQQLGCELLSPCTPIPYLTGALFKSMWPSQQLETFFFVYGSEGGQQIYHREEIRGRLWENTTLTLGYEAFEGFAKLAIPGLDEADRFTLNAQWEF